MVMIHNLGVMANNMRVVVHLLMFFFAMCDYNILALFNVGDINNNIVLNMAFLMMLLLGSLVALMILLVMTMRTTVVTHMARLCLSVTLHRRDSAIHKSRGQEED